MFIKRFFMFAALALGLAACNGPSGWNSEYGNVPAANPAQMQSGFYYPEYGIYGPAGDMYTYTPVSGQKNVSVLLPLSGPQQSVGRGIASSVEMAFMARKYDNISVTFYDVSGPRMQKQNTIANALATNPDIIIGPVFAEDAQMVRDMKPGDLPVLSFTSDANAVGGGVMTTALMPSQSVEQIVREMSRDHATGFVILAPNTASGQLMAGAAIQSANIYNIPVAGLFYYNEGGSESIKKTAERAAMYGARSAANTRAREILSDILVKETLTAEQKSSINNQLDKLSRADTVGRAPYDAILFLGNASDSRSLASFLRYYDVGARDAAFYGTALWDSPELLNDLSMSGAKFAVLPPTSPDFAKLFAEVSGAAPSRLDSFGYDAANLAIGMIYSNKNPAAYLLDPSGYRGLDGLVRLRPIGVSERALSVVELNGGGTTRIVRNAPTDFLTPLYNANSASASRPAEMELVGDGVNPMDFIKIPENLRAKYKSKTFGANTAKPVAPQSTEVVIMPEDDAEVFASPDFQPTKLEPIDRKLIDSVEVN